MANEDKLRADTQRANHAQHLLNDEILKGAFDNLEAAYLTKWRETMIGDVDAREKLFLAVNVIGKVREHLHKIVADGNLAKKELEDMAKLAEPRRRFGIV